MASKLVETFRFDLSIVLQRARSIHALKTAPLSRGAFCGVIEE